MKEKLIDEIKTAMRTVITADQMSILCNVLNRTLQNIVIAEKLPDSEARVKANSQLQTLFISAKRVEGCSEKTLKYYASTIEYMLRQIDKNIVDITTTDLRCYLASYQSNNQSSKVTIDNIRRIFSSFFAWLEDEDYILKSPVRRIHKVKTGSLIKEVLSDENLEILRDNCTHIRDLAIIDMLSSTGIRVGELVKINREDIDFHERECVVFGKGNKEREVYFNARTKIHLKQYLESRTDDNPALFVSIAKPHNRLKISGVELRLRQLGRKVSIHKVHPHKFRRTLATMAIDKGTYDYSPCFSLVKEQISGADIAIGNLEVPIGGKPYSGYPAFCAPDEYLYAIKEAGFNVLLTANNHCLDRGKKGLERDRKSVV